MLRIMEYVINNFISWKDQINFLTCTFQYYTIILIICIFITYLPAY